MPRGGGRSSSGNRSSGGGMFSRGPTRSAAAPARPPAPRQAPAPVQQQAPASGGMMSGLGGTIMQGMAFGAGSEVAHQAVRSVMGGGSGHGGHAPAEQQQ